MNIGDIIHGFKLEEIKDSVETGSKAFLFNHEKTNATLLYLKNEDENKAFGIGFNTPPEDSTGIAHIVEHTVLSGSQKFKTREPFMELIKSSMATFLNAMTFSDMTIYPISSMNEKDFRNLMDVYLDAVFFPQIYDNKKIFMQEGWHHELLNKEDDIIYKGVVYNEMKGAYSSAESQVVSQIMQNMNKGTTYAHESGGYPYSIPNLTYENFKAFHKKYYHPSNSFIYLYGNLNLEESLKFINDEYLVRFNKEDCRGEVVLVENKDEIRHESFKYASDDTSTNQKNSYLGYTVEIGKVTSKLDNFMISLLTEILVNSDSSPVRQELLKNNIAEDLMGIDSDGYYLNLSIIAKNSDSNRIDEFTSIIEKTIKNIVDNGIDKNLLKAALNRQEMRLREAHGTLKGIIYFINSISPWRYKEHPLSLLSYNETFEYLRENIDNGFFEKYLDEKILKNNKKLITVHTPDPNVFINEDEKEKERLKKYKESLSDEELNALIKENEELIKFQTTEDSKEDKESIPHLDINEISNKIARIDGDIINHESSKILLHKQNTSGISYIHFVFPMNHLREEEIVYATYLAQMLGIVDTKNFNYSDLNNEILMNTSGINFSGSVFKNTKNIKDYSAKFIASSSAIGDNWRKIFTLLNELINNSVLNNKTRLKEILNSIKSSMEMSFDSRGNSLVSSRVKSFFSEAERYQDYLGGIAFYDHLNDLLNNFEEKSDNFIENINKIYSTIFTKNNVIVAVTSQEDKLNEIKVETINFLNSLKDIKNEEVKIKFNLEKLKEGLTSSSNVQYVAKGYNLIDLGYKHTGAMVVLSNLLSKDYLHNAIRARGGAYGTGIVIEVTGEITTSSYRDPNLSNTIKVYDDMYKFIEEGKFDESDIRNYIIGSMTTFNPPIAPSSVNGIMINRMLRNVTIEDIEKRLDEALKTTREEIMSFAPMLKEVMEKDYLSVFGNKSNIEKEKDYFTVIRPIKK